MGLLISDCEATGDLTERTERFDQAARDYLNHGGNGHDLMTRLYQMVTAQPTVTPPYYGGDPTYPDSPVAYYELISEPAWLSWPLSSRVHGVSATPPRDLTLYQHGEIDLGDFNESFAGPFECMQSFSRFQPDNITLPGSDNYSWVFPADITRVFWYYNHDNKNYLALFQVDTGHYGFFSAKSSGPDFESIARGWSGLDDVSMSLYLNHSASVVIAQLSDEDYQRYQNYPLSNNITAVA